MKKTYKRIGLVSIFALYLLTLVWLIFAQHRVPSLNYGVNYVPFRTISADIAKIATGDALVARNAAKYLVLNLLLFFPLGCLLPLMWKKMQKYKRFICVPFVLSLLIEIGQYLTHLGVADIDDIILNVCGASIGFVIVCLFIRCCGVYRKGKNETTNP